MSYNYGKNIGIAFQLVDDWLDFVSSADLLGKNQSTVYEFHFRMRFINCKLIKFLFHLSILVKLAELEYEYTMPSKKVRDKQAVSIV